LNYLPTGTFSPCLRGFPAKRGAHPCEGCPKLKPNPEYDKWKLKDDEDFHINYAMKQLLDEAISDGVKRAVQE